MRRVSLAAFVALAFPSPAPAALHVAPAGSSTGSCVRAAPCTVARADALAGPGTTIVVDGGQYGSASLNASGAGAARVRWVSAARWGAHFTSMQVNGHFVDVEGFDVGDSSATILLDINGNYSRVIGNRVHDQQVPCGGDGAAGIEAHGWRDGGYNGHHQEIIGNVVEDIGIGPRDGSCSLVHGIYTAVPYVTVANNIVRRAIGVGIHAWHAAAYNTWVNNTVVDSGSHGLMVGNGDTDASAGRGFYVANNVAVGNRYYAIAECCDSSVIGPNMYVNNLGWANGYARVVQSTRNRGTETGSLNADPLFVGYAAGDYRLRAGSPAIDSGTATDAPSTDYAGTARPQGTGVDRGAYERAMQPVPPDRPALGNPPADDIPESSGASLPIARTNAGRAGGASESALQLPVLTMASDGR
jgi:hypothetical protein